MASINCKTGIMTTGCFIRIKVGSYGSIITTTERPENMLKSLLILLYFNTSCRLLLILSLSGIGLQLKYVKCQKIVIVYFESNFQRKTNYTYQNALKYVFKVINIQFESL